MYCQANRLKGGLASMMGGLAPSKKKIEDPQSLSPLEPVTMAAANQCKQH